MARMVIWGRAESEYQVCKGKAVRTEHLLQIIEKKRGGGWGRGARFGPRDQKLFKTILRVVNRLGVDETFYVLFDMLLYLG